MIAWAVGAALAADVLATEPAPAQGAVTVVSVQDDLGRPVIGATVVASFAPGLAAAREETLGVTDALGRVRWTPDHGGVVVLSTVGGALRTRVAGPPPEDALAALSLLAAGALLAAAWGARP